MMKSASLSVICLDDVINTKKIHRQNRKILTSLSRRVKKAGKGVPPASFFFSFLLLEGAKSYMKNFQYIMFNC